MAKESKKRGPISKAGVKRLMKEGNPDIRIKPSAVNSVVNLLEEKAKCYGKRGAQIEKARKHKTITRDTVRAVEDLDTCGTAPREIKVTKADIKEGAKEVTAKESTKAKGKGKGKGKGKAKA